MEGPPVSIAWRSAGLILAGLLVSCSGADGCRFVVLQVGDRDCTREQCPRVRSNCELVWVGSPQAAIPAKIEQPDQNESDRSAATFAAAVEQYYASDSNVALAELEAEFSRIQGHPEWLPRQTERREVVYQALAVLLRHRVESGDGPGAQVVADWLSLHMSDIEPSVKWMPPEVEYIAARAREKARPRWGRVTVRSAEGCSGPATAFVDGGRSGPVPGEVSLPPGRHVLVVECDGFVSWSRWVDPSENQVIPVVRPGLESRLHLRPGALAVGRSMPENERVILLRHSMQWLSAKGGVLYDPDDPGTSLFLVGQRQRMLETGQDNSGSVLLVRDFNQVSAPDLLALAGFTTSALSLAAGILANLQYNDMQADTSSGLVDRRSDAGVWFVSSIALYAVSALSGAAGLGCLIWGLVDEEQPVSPLF